MLQWELKWVALGIFIAAKYIQVPSPVVETTSGLVRGRISDSGSLYQYYGIPYATVNQHNRFQAPLPPPKWNDIFDAVNEHVRCPQKMIGSMVMGDPDCLQLFINSPIDQKQHKLLPVMMYVHGGCFFEGTGSPFLYGGENFAEHGVVYVGVNYRLNVEGFLCLGIKEAPGNAGVKDLIAALKWIKGNIEAFGGDPDNVTVFGESAGAALTSLLMLSPAASGLFHRAILQSGSTFAPWALQHDPIETASNLVKNLGYNTKDPYNIYSIVSNKSVEELISAIKTPDNKNYVTSEMLFVPCIEQELPEVEAIITQHPRDIIQSGNYSKVPMIIGYNNNEGIYFVSKDYGFSVKSVDPEETLQSDLKFKNVQEKNATLEKLRSHYFPEYKQDYLTDMIDLYSDLHFKYPSVAESELYARTTDQPIYYYNFRYDGLLNGAKFVSKLVFVDGAAHADELIYMFKPHMLPTSLQFLERTTIKRMVTMWTNFAKYSDPTPSRSPLLPFRWRPGRELNPIALVIDRQITTARMWDESMVSLWNDTYTKHRRKPYKFKNYYTSR